MDDERFVENSDLREQIALVLHMCLTPESHGAAFIPVTTIFPAFDHVIVTSPATNSEDLATEVKAMAEALRQRVVRVEQDGVDHRLEWPFGDGRLLGVPIHAPGGEALGLFLIASRTAGAQPLGHPAIASAVSLLASLVQRNISYNQMHLAYRNEKSRARRLAQLAEMDGLSGLLNHQAFKARCNERLSDPDKRHALMMFDVDSLKQVNDVYGHQFGDVYLSEIAASIKRSLPFDTVIGRIGGDEFAALVELHTDAPGQLERLMSRCSSDVQRVAARLGKPTLGHISIGTSPQTGHEMRLSALMVQADAALYACKHSRRSSGEVYDPAVHSSLSAILIRPKFLRAIKLGELEPYFQPIVDLNTGQRAGYEMLARWNDPTRGLLVPQQFSAVFSAPELAEKLTESLLDKAFGAFSRFADDPGQTLAVNLGTADLVKQEFVFELQSLVSKHRLRWEQIGIEVTENTMMGATNGPVFQNLTELRRRGASVALDDFGTGYAGLAHLRSWPVDTIKVDRSHVVDLAQSPAHMVIAKSLIEIARALDLKLVAEGVEDDATASVLRSMGCQFAQGYFFGRPAPFSAYVSD